MFKFVDKIPPLARVPLRYGLLVGVLGFVLVVVLYYINRHPFLVPVFFDFRVVLFGVLFFFSLKELREYHFNGLLFFWQGLAACFVFISSYALISSSLIWAFGLLVPNFVQKYIQLFLDQVKTFPPEIIERIGKEAYQLNLQALPETTAFDLAFLYFWQCFVIGFFVSIIISVILRRQPQY
jgi:Protein of unknown function (DUF4199)